MQSKQEKWVNTGNFKAIFSNSPYIPLRRREAYSRGKHEIEMLGYEQGNIWISFCSLDDEFSKTLLEEVKMNGYEPHNCGLDMRGNHFNVAFRTTGKTNIEKIPSYLQLLNQFINIEQIMDELYPVTIAG